MTKFDLSQIKPIPGFDSLKWKRKVHAQILRETAGMTPEQRREHRRQACERLDKEIEHRRAERVKLAESTGSDKPV